MNHHPAKRGMSIRRLIIGFCCLVLVVTMVSCSAAEAEPIKVGILHSQNGVLAASERPVADATLMAIDEINEAGGLLGRQIKPVIVDARSDSAFAAEEAQRLIVEEYILLGSLDVNAAVQNIVDLQPDVLLNTINGDTNVALFRALSDAGISAVDIPVVSFSIGEAEIQEMDISDIVGHYAAWNYFQSVETSANKRFVEKYQSRYGADRVTSDPIEAGYNGVHLWARAVKEGGSVDRAPVALAVADQTLSAPQGFVRVDPENQHLWKTMRIGQMRSDGQFDIVWDPGTIISPRPFLKSRPQGEWEQFLEDLYFMWNGNWENPG